MEPLFAYFGPETMLPAASILAALLGFVLMFWRFVINLIKKPFQLILGKAADQSPTTMAQDLPSGEGEEVLSTGNVAEENASSPQR